MSQTFRNDINGLRAIAVIAVVLFHFNSSWVPGGFSGVDVFFVISGFLMTGIIFRGIEHNNFSILKFYVARANRIIPALAVLCLVLLVFGWFYLTPLEYQALGKHAASSVIFLSNFIYRTESGYFDAASHEKWLLHTWSLSVEWQFYIIYPIILVLLSKLFSTKTIKSLLLAGTVLGFIFCAIATYKWPTSSYYLLPMRAWEMMLGGIAYLYPFTLQENRKKLFEWTGLLLIVGSYFLISAENLWPGYLAILPVLGTFLIIQAHRNNSVITNNLVFQKLGTWSYSIYLWHWPLVVAIFTFKLPEYYIYLGITLSILLGFLSYKYIEQIKFRNDFSKIFSYLKCKPLYISGVVALLGGVLHKNPDYFNSLRFTADQITVVNQQKRDPREAICGNIKNGISPGCTYGEGPVKAIVIGDSHSQAQNIAIGNRAKLAGGSILTLGLSGCPTIKDVYSIDIKTNEKSYTCGKLVANSLDMISKKYPGVPVIIINRSSQYIHGQNEMVNPQPLKPYLFVDKFFNSRTEEYKSNLKLHMIDTACSLSKKNQVYLIRPTPELKINVPLTMFRGLTLAGNNESIKISREEYDKRHRFVYEMQNEIETNCGAKILDPISYLCDKDFCYGDKNGTPLYFDDDHLSSYGSELISPIYDEVFN